jgi:hypothetical protein
MPSIHRQPGRPFWFCAFTLFDPETHTSKRVFRSTKTRDKKQALEICRAWHKAALLARNGKLNADAAREVITRGVSDVYAAANLESLESATVRKWCEKWLQAKSIEAEESTQARYKRIVDRFLRMSGAKANAIFQRCKPETSPGFVIVRQRHSLARLPISVSKFCASALARLSDRAYSH